ncbi:cobalamin biosynthesis protein CobD/CbiB [Bowmanella dokdonensis]|uniref:Cobalamin biosynthesis protein n=1 Tax=Bowmanella dokdonensis TaxID=751969 RepID=A0A939IMP8_9ALTE|nr:cobalamin biosynthesis protein [Bowmanella dokdonensis]MBN7824025.1 cobalamin biosynthesis protein [Bowmanella dokdonensis]
MPEKLFLHPALQPALIILAVWVVEKLWVWPDKYHPLSFFRLLALRMAEKVNPLDHSPGQQKLSGTLAPLVLLTPILICIGLFIGLAEYPVFFDTLLLYMAIRFQPVLRNMKRCEQALMASKKSLARDKAKTLLLRETDKLTVMGLSKAVIEAGLLRFFYQVCTPIFWFLLLGGLGALTYRLLYEFRQVWSTKLPTYRHFGRPVAWITGVMQYIPVRIGLWILAITENITCAWRARRRLAKSCNSHSLLLATVGGALGIELGGPAFYAGVKVRLPRGGGAREASVTDIRRARHAVNKTTATMLVLILLGAALLFAFGPKI